MGADKNVGPDGGPGMPIVFQSLKTRTVHLQTLLAYDWVLHTNEGVTLSIRYTMPYRHLPTRMQHPCPSRLS